MNALHAVEVRFAADHPTAAGHFPGNPIIPGAVLLDEVLRAIATAGGGSAMRAVIRSAKFLRPVRPGERVLIRWHVRPSGETRFECVMPDPERLVLTGALIPNETAG